MRIYVIYIYIGLEVWMSSLSALSTVSTVNDERFETACVLT